MSSGVDLVARRRRVDGEAASCSEEAAQAEEGWPHFFCTWCCLVLPHFLPNDKPSGAAQAAHCVRNISCMVKSPVGSPTMQNACESLELLKASALLPLARLADPRRFWQRSWP